MIAKITLDYYWGIALKVGHEQQGIKPADRAGALSKMTIRLELDFRYNVRAHKGERRGKGGALIKCTIINAGTEREAIKEARQMIAGSERAAPGYSALIEARFYDREAFYIDALKAVPYKVAGAI